MAIILTEKLLKSSILPFTGRQKQVQLATWFCSAIQSNLTPKVGHLERMVSHEIIVAGLTNNLLLHFHKPMLLFVSSFSASHRSRSWQGEETFAVSQ